MKPMHSENALAGRKKTFMAALIALAAAAIYSNTLSSPFLLDDHDYIINFSRLYPVESYWPPHGTRYFTYLSFALNYLAGGLDVRGYHLVNIAIHAANGILVFLMAGLLMRTPRMEGKGLPAFHIAALAALLFTAHPVQTEAVTYISQRFASLATLLYLSGITIYLKWRLSERGSMRTALYALSLLFVYSAQMTKEMSFTLPFVILMIELAFFRGPYARRLLNLVPFLLAFSVIPFMLFGPQFGGGVGGKVAGAQLRDLQIFSAHDYLVTQFRVIVTYLRLLVLPVGQNLEWDFPLFRSFLNPQVLASLLFILTLFIGAVYLFIRFLKGGSAYLALIATGALWFFTTISVESSVVPIKDLVFEHRLYLPSVGAAIAASAAIFLAAGRAPSWKALAAACVLLVLPLSIAAFQRNKVWQSGVALYEDAVKKSPDKERVRYNLAWEYHMAGEIDKAVAQYYEVLKIAPGKHKAHFNLGAIFMTRGDNGRAKTHFLEAARLDPKDPYVYNNLAAIYHNEKEIGRAIEMYRLAVQANPRYEDASYNLALALIESGEVEEAERHLLNVISINPSSADAMINLGRLYAKRGEKDRAREAFSMGIKARPELYDLMTAEIRRLEVSP